MIEFENVNKVYVNAHQALTKVKFCMRKGELAFLTGHSGAGKSTLLKLIMLLEQATDGEVRINNTALSSIAPTQIPEIRRNLGIVMQNPYLLNDRNVFDNICLPLTIAGMRPQDISRRVRAALDKVGLLAKEREYPNALSAGEQQRVSIARAVVNRPQILLADEPTGNLDPALSSEIMNLFQRFSEFGVTVLIASHDISLINHMRHRVLTLSQGRLIHDTGAAHAKK